jgi:hypothetical protein
MRANDILLLVAVLALALTGGLVCIPCILARRGRASASLVVLAALSLALAGELVVFTFALMWCGDEGGVPWCHLAEQVGFVVLYPGILLFGGGPPGLIADVLLCAVIFFAAFRFVIRSLWRGRVSSNRVAS